MKKSFSAVALFAIFAGFLNAEPKITKFEIQGLKRTKEFAVQRDLKKFIGKEASAETLHSIENSLQADNLFTNISIGCEPITENESRIKISLEEKMSILPLPIVAVNDGVFSAGAFLIDSNAMGLKDFFMLGGIFSRDNISGMAFFSRPPKGSSLGFSIYTGISKSDTELVTTKDDSVYDFGSLSFRGSLGVSKKFFDCFSAKLSTGFGIIKVDGSDEIKGEIESEKVWESSAAIDFKSADWNGVFMSEKFAAVKAFVDVTPCRDVFNGFELKIKIQQPILDKLRIVQSASCFYEFDAPIVFYTGGRSASVSLFPTEFSSDSMAGLSLGLEYAALKTKIGLFSVYAVYQTARAKDFDRTWVFNQGAGGGMKMYLSKVAFPACSVEVIYNITEKEFRTGFSIGMSM